MADEATIIKIKTVGVGMPAKPSPVRYTALYDALRDGKLNKPFELILGKDVLLDNARFNLLVYAEQNLQAFEVEIGKDYDAHSIVVLKTRRGRNGTKKGA